MILNNDSNNNKIIYLNNRKVKQKSHMIHFNFYKLSNRLEWNSFHLEILEDIIIHQEAYNNTTNILTK